MTTHWKDKSVLEGPQVIHASHCLLIFLPSFVGTLDCWLHGRRHKMVAKILEGKDILEIGCQEGFGTMFVAPYVKSITCVDFYEPFIEGFKKYSLPYLTNCKVKRVDITMESVLGPFDGAFSLDVLEHIDPNRENYFGKTCAKSLKPSGTAIVGMPIESQTYASEGSKVGHVNCKTGID